MCVYLQWQTNRKAVSISESTTWHENRTVCEVTAPSVEQNRSVYSDQTSLSGRELSDPFRLQYGWAWVPNLKFYLFFYSQMLKPLILWKMFNDHIKGFPNLQKKRTNLLHHCHMIIWWYIWWSCYQLVLIILRSFEMFPLARTFSVDPRVMNLSWWAVWWI